MHSGGGVLRCSLETGSPIVDTAKIPLAIPPLTRETTYMYLKGGEGRPLANIDDLTVVGTSKDGVNCATRLVKNSTWPSYL